MKVLMINSVCGIGSTGRICTDLAQEFERNGDEVKIAYGRDGNVPEKFRKYAVRIGNDMNMNLHGLKTRIFDEHGFGSKQATRKFLEWAKVYHPDLLWLHNLHGYYINIEMLFDWIKENPDMEVKWTLHDCWAFTGHCAYFTAADCEKWKTHCEHCPQKDRYPTSKIKDNSANNYERKKKAFTGVKNMTLITPSKWLADLVRESFLAEYKVEVCYNKIDTNIFKPTPSNFREKYGLTDKKIILGVASVWDERKGLKDFIELSKMLDARYAIVLVGLSERQINGIPEKLPNVKCINDTKDFEEILQTDSGVVVGKGVKNLVYAITQINSEFKEEKGKGTAEIICIPRTNNPTELAEIYTAADYFVNPTYEDNYPTVNLEAQACGTYVITYDTGGCRETILK